jgi:hypothetical protein
MTRAYNVIDADGHILEPLTLWNDYMDPKYRDQAPRIVRDEEGKQRLQVGEKLLGSKKGIGAIGGVGARDGTVVDDTLEYEQGRKGGFDPHARIPDMDLDGIDAAFLYPSIGLFAGAVEDPAVAAAMSRAYNRWLADYCKPYPDRLFGVAMIPMQSVDAAFPGLLDVTNGRGCAGLSDCPCRCAVPGNSPSIQTVISASHPRRDHDADAYRPVPGAGPAGPGSVRRQRHEVAPGDHADGRLPS